MPDENTTVVVQRYLDALAGETPAEPIIRGLLDPASSGSGLSPDARRMLEAIDSLPEDEREAFDLVRIQGLTYGEAAELLSVATKTVQRRLDRGLRLLTERLSDLGPGATPPGSS